MAIWELAQGPLQLWLLFALRAIAFLLTAPIFSARFVPQQFRIYLAFLMAVIAYSAWAPGKSIAILQPGDFILAGINEILTGLVLGTILSLVLLAFQFAGSLAGYQMGLSIVNVLDPQSQQQVSIVGDFLFACATLAFLELNLHFDVLRLWQRSLELAPPGGLVLEAGTAEYALVLESITSLLMLGLQISMPLVLFLLLVDAALGILARVVPQLNIFVLGTSAKGAIGLILLSLLVLEVDALLLQPHNDDGRRAVSFLREAAGRSEDERAEESAASSAADLPQP
ncbi:flagellar biosynthetic protein FliR [bacterium]|nr:flagellar biosynthetic protein FliR [bacterium]